MLYQCGNFWSHFLFPFKLDTSCQSLMTGKLFIFQQFLFQILSTPPTETWFEFTPHEAGYPAVGAFINTSLFGSDFENGELKVKKKEKTICYLEGECLKHHNVQIVTICRSHAALLLLSPSPLCLCYSPATTLMSVDIGRQKKVLGLAVAPQAAWPSPAGMPPYSCPAPAHPCMGSCLHGVVLVGFLRSCQGSAVKVQAPFSPWPHQPLPIINNLSFWASTHTSL